MYGVSRNTWDTDHTKFGYIDETGQVSIPAKFDAAQDFSEGLAAVAFNVGKKPKHAFQRPRQWGFIDKVGKMVVRPQFQRAKSFSGGLAAVQNLRNKWGYIDQSGQIVVPFQFESAASFFESKAAVQSGEKFGFIDRTGAKIVPAQFPDAGNFSEGLARVGVTGIFPNAFFAPHQYDAGSSKFGYIDESGHLVFEMDAVNVEDFSEGLAAFEVENENVSAYASRPSVVTGRTGFIWCGYLDKAGRVAVQPRYQSCGQFTEGLARVSVDGEWQYIDSSGKIVLSAKYYWVGAFRHGLAAVRDENNRRGYIDKSGKLVFLTPTSTDSSNRKR